MSIKQTFDYIIAGAGAAGLSLLWHILNTPELKKKNVLVIDKSFDEHEEKTWCFWDDNQIPFKHLIKKKWSKIQVKSKGEIFSQDSGLFNYHCIKSSQFRKDIITTAKTFSNVQFLEASVSSFSENQKSAIVSTDVGEFYGEWTFQSVIHPYKKSPPEKPVLQHFMGYLIETNNPIFDENAMTMMDFNEKDFPEPGTHFFYVLPYSSTSALVEYTIFSDNLLDESGYNYGVNHYLKTSFGLNKSDYKIIEKEKGVIPMDDTPRKTFLNTKTLSIGISGGLTKPTTGYTFTRIQKHCRSIVNDLKNSRTPSPYSAAPYRYRMYDHLLLNILKKEPEKSYTIFHNLFKHNSIDTILRFLDESTSLKDEVKIFSSLPYYPFLKALVLSTPKLPSL